MRTWLISLAAIATLAGSAPAFGLNPQPLPPGLREPGSTEPPVACAKFKSRLARERCIERSRRHATPAIESATGGGGAGKTAIGSQTGGAGAGK